MKFSDGVPLTAKDVAFTYNRVLAKDSVEGTNWLSYLNGVTKVTAPNDTTVVLKLKEPNATLPLLPIPIVPEHVWKNVSEKEIKTYKAEPTGGKPVVGSGPFRLVQGTADGSTFKFEANPDYWGGTPHIDEIVFQFYKNDDSAVQALIKGEIDFVEDITALEVKSLQSQTGVTAHNGNSPGFDEIAFNTGSVSTATGGHPIGDPNPAVLDPKFRHALGYALNLPQLIQKVYQGAGLPGTTIVPPVYDKYHWEPPADQKFTFDLAKAGRCSTRPATSKGSDGLRTLPDGKPIGTLRLAARSDSPTSLNTMDYFKQWLSDLGIKSEVSTYSSSQLTDEIYQGNFDAFQWGWYVEPDPDSMLSYMTCGQRQGSSDSFYCNKQYDKLYDQQHDETDEAARAAEIKKMQQILYRDSPYLVTAYSAIGEAVRSDRFACFCPAAQPRRHLDRAVRRLQLHQAARPAWAQAGDCRRCRQAIGASRERRRARPSTGFLGRRRRGGGRAGRRSAASSLMRRRATRRPRVNHLAADEPGHDPSAVEPRRRAAAAATAVRRPQGARLDRQPDVHARRQLLPVPGAAGRPGPNLGRGPVQPPGAARGVQQDLRSRPAAPAAVRHVS